MHLHRFKLLFNKAKMIQIFIDIFPHPTSLQSWATIGPQANRHSHFCRRADSGPLLHVSWVVANKEVKRITSGKQCRPK